MQARSISFAFLSTLAVRLKYSLLSSFFLAHSSLITALWLATSLARNLLSPSVIILILIWLIIEAGHGTCPADFGYLLPHAILWGQQCSLPPINPWKQHPTHLSVTISHSRSIPCLSNTFTVSIILKFWLIAGSTLSYCPVLARDCTPDFLKHTES